MKKVLSFVAVCLAAAGSFGFASNLNAQEVIAFWDFNNGFDFRPDDPDTEPTPIQITLEADQGSGILYQQRAEIDGNGKGGNAFNQAVLGINVPEGQGIAWDDFTNAGDNDGEFFGVVSTAGFENIEISFDFLGNDDDENGDEVNDSDGFTRFDFKYSLLDLIDVNPDEVPDVGDGLIKDFDGESIDIDTNIDVTNSSVDYQRLSFQIDPAVNNQSVFAFRLDDFRENNQVRFDNVLVTGIAIAVPEPSSAAWLSLIGLSALIRRRRS